MLPSLAFLDGVRPAPRRTPRHAPLTTPRVLLLLLPLMLMARPDADAQAPGSWPPPTGSPVADMPYWRWQTTQPTGQTLRAFHAFSDSSIIAVGSHGTAVKTTDAGRTWQMLPTGAQREGISVSFADANTGWAAFETNITNPGTQNRCGPGQVRRTTDGGQTWTAQPTGENRSVSNPRVVAVSPTEAYVLYEWSFRTPGNPPSDAYNLIRHTTNGGQTWTLLPPLVVNRMLLPVLATDIVFPTPATGFLVGRHPVQLFGYNYLVGTTDHGQTWRNVAPDSATFTPCGIYFLDDQRGWVAGASATGGPVLYRTSNGGRTWTPITTTPPTSFGWGFTAVTFSDAQHGLLLGRADGWFATADGGQTWTYIGFLLGNQARLRPGSGAGWAVGEYGRISRTTDFGATWTPRHATLAGYGTREVAFSDPTHGWALAQALSFTFTNNAVLRTTRRGAPWERQDLPLRVSSVNWTYSQLIGAAFPDADTAWVLGKEDPFQPHSSFLLYTATGGQSWERQPLPPLPGALLAVAARDGRRAVAIGDSGVILATHDGGASWTRRVSPFAQPREVTWADDITLYALADTSLYRSPDAGLSWQLVPGQLPGMEGIYFTSALMGYGQNSADIYRTADGGRTWTRTQLSGLASLNQNGDRTPQIRSFHFRSAREGWAFGLTDIFETQDAGLTWTKRAYVGGYGSGCFGRGALVDRYNVWASGSGGAVHYTEKFIQADTALTQLTYCAGDSLALAFTTEGVFGAAERDYRVQLSNPMGRFRAGHTTAVGQGTSSPLQVRLPAALPQGRHYRLRVIRADSSVLGGDNARDLTIYARPAAVVAPAGAQTICQGDSVQLSAPAGFAAYAWTTGATTASVWVRAAGTYAVRVGTVAACLGAASAPVTVSVTPRPAPPTITVQTLGSGIVILTSSSPTSNQWLLNGTPISGATSPIYTASTAAQSGQYTVVVTRNGCASPASAGQSAVVTGLDAEAARAGLTLYPNPATTAVVVRCESGLRTVVVRDLTGRVVLQLPGAGRETVVPLAAVPPGSYLVESTLTDGRVLTRRLLVGH